MPPSRRLIGFGLATVQRESQVIVVGAGISGLATAYALASAGCRVLVLEQSSRVGGCIRSERTPDGYLIEHGPNSLLNLNPDVDRLCGELGLDRERVVQQPATRQRYLVKARTLVPVPSRAHQFPLTPLWSLKGKLRALAEPFIVSAPPEGDESVAAFVRRRFGPEMVDYAVEPFVAGIFAGDPEQLSMASSFPHLAALERASGSVVGGLIGSRLRRGRSRAPVQVFSFRGGVGRLPETLQSRLGDRVITGVRVAEVRRECRDGAVRFAVHAETRDGAHAFVAERLVVATPADVAGRLLSPLSPPLADELEQIPYAPVGLVHLGVARSALSRFPNGSGCLVPKRERLPILGSLWSSNVYPDRAPEGRVLLTNYIGGVRDSDVLKWSDDELVALVVDALRDLVGLSGRPEFVRVLRHPRAIPQYLLGHGARVAKIDQELAPLSGVYLAGNYLHGVSIRDCLTQGAALADRIVGDLGRIEDPGSASLPTRSSPASALQYSS